MKGFTRWIGIALPSILSDRRSMDVGLVEEMSLYKGRLAVSQGPPVLKSPLLRRGTR